MPEPSSKAEYVVGVDLGGTKILAGIFTMSLKCIGRSKMSTKPERGRDGYWREVGLRLKSDRGRSWPHGAGSERTEMHLREPGVLGGAGEPHGSFPPGSGSRSRRAKDRSHGDAR